jgi:hypothetical protein
MDEKKFNALSKPQQDVVIKIAAEAERQGVRPEFAIAIAEAETGGAFSHFRGDKVLTSPAGARGLMQLLPSTVELYNKKMNADIDPNDEDSNIKGGVFILKDLLTKYKSPRIATVMYNASPQANAEFVKKYETDPDAAIMSLRPETHKYSLRVSQNFNLDDDKETGLIPVEKEPSRYESYESEATKLKKEQEAQAEADKNKPPEPPTPKTLLERASDAANELDPAVAALLGAGANIAGPMLVKPALTPAQEANLTAQDRLELARTNLNKAVPQGVENLEDTFRESQGELERIKNEQRLADARLKGLPKAPPVIEPPAPSSPFPQQIDAPSRTKAGDAGAVNWVHSMSDDVPEVVANKALNMRGDNPRGGQAIIDANMAAMQKQADLGLGDFGLIRTEGGVQLALPPTTVAERQADIDRQNQASQAELERQAESQRIQQEAQARRLEMERMAHEAELERLRQERAAAGQRHNVITGQVKAVNPLQRAMTKAETDAEIARRKLARAPEPSTPAGRAVLNTGKIVGRGGLGAIAGAAGVMSYQEALERAKAGDTSEAVLKALEAGSAAAMLTPPVGKPLRIARKAGLASGIGLGGFELTRRLLKDSAQE